ncbi:thyrotropin-releasing hormone receptor-like, partial [Limulus polyphemus]|uniref:Thyrotropin-releasing hormone receptor-like n=1 Tax=Limulus polyphemus TaxID=6850 RepID=A0ABM1BJD1_LIMPO
KIVPFVELTVAHGSIFTILAISFERYYAICKPLRAGYTCTKMRALVIIVSVWMVALLITSPILAIAEYSYMDYIDDTKVPVCLTVAQTVWKKAYFIFITTLFFWLPLVVLLVVYGVITKQLIMDRQMLHSGSDHYQMRARKQVVWMLVAVVTCFFLCLMPFRTFTMWVIVVPADRVKALGMEKYYIVLYFCRVMLYLNSAVNPILYNLISSKFRDAFINLLTCKYQRRILRQATFTTTSTSLSQHTSLKGRSSNVHSCYLPRSCVVKAHPCVETYV